MGKPLDTSPSFRPIYLTSCISKFYKRSIPSRLLFFLESTSVRFPDFHPGRSTLDQILFLSQSILDGFNKPEPGSRTIIAAIDFSKAFHSVWHPAVLHKLISGALPLCFACRTQYFLSHRWACVIFLYHKSRFFRVRRRILQDPFLALSFSLFPAIISLRLCLLPSAALFMLTTWPFGSFPPRRRLHKKL